MALVDSLFLLKYSTGGTDHPCSAGELEMCYRCKIVALSGAGSCQCPCRLSDGSASTDWSQESGDGRGE